jgi:hypothetical protein
MSTGSAARTAGAIKANMRLSSATSLAIGRLLPDNLAMAERFSTYADFWPFYLKEHAKPATRVVHYFGTLASALVLVWAIVTQSWWGLLAVPFFGYGPAWFGHFFIEKNKPATFQAPVWSLISDYRMCGLWLSGRLGHELMKYQIRS